MSIHLTRGDITTFSGEAIVNAANNSLLGGGGVDGAIHRAAGPQLLEECKKIGGCPTGEARITDGYNLPVKYVIHTVGPVWNGGSEQEEELLESAYLSSLKLASKHKIRSIAFPNISTGIYHFPKELAAQIAVRVATEFISDSEHDIDITFVCFDEENYTLYKQLVS